jgi:hypothetical protein
VKRIKTFGLAVAMALALTVLLGASAASAAVFNSPSGGELTWNGTRSGSSHTLKLPPGQNTCSNVSFSGKMTGFSASAITVTPELANCSWLINVGAPVSWSIGTCKYQFNVGEWLGSSAKGTLDIVGCKTPMRVEALGCETSINNQSGLGSVEYQNTTVEGKPGLLVKANLNNLVWTARGCAGIVPNGTHANGAYIGEWTVKGTQLGEQYALEVGAAAIKPVSFATGKAPATISGKFGVNQTGYGKAIFATPTVGPVNCKEHKFSGTSGASTFAEMAVTASYGDCQFLGQSTLLNMGGCSYVFDYSGQLDIVGETCASNPITYSALGCTVTIGPQSGISGILYGNLGSGALRRVSTGGEATGLTYSLATGCPSKGTHSNGAYRSIDEFTTASGLWLAVE